MADNAYFYNSQNGDRLYNADSFEKWLKKFFTTGVFSGELFTTAGTGMKTHVSSGYCNINGKVKIFDGTELTHENANASYNRIDLIVAERNDTERDFFLKVITGDVASQPIPKALVRTGNIYQIAIASVYIPKGSTEIAQENITDLRSNTDMCGIVTGTVQEMDYSQFSEQFSAYYDHFCNTNEQDFNVWYENYKNQANEDLYVWTEDYKVRAGEDFSRWETATQTQYTDFMDNFQVAFNAWYANMQGQLTSDAATNLQSQIDSIKNIYKQGKRVFMPATIAYKNGRKVVMPSATV